MHRLQSQLVSALQENLRRREDRPQIPEAGRLLWAAFLELDATRSFSATGPSPITYAEIESWARINRYPLAPHHVAILRAMDAALIRQFAEEVKRQQSNKRQGAKSRAALTPAFFDARFSAE